MEIILLGLIALALGFGIGYLRFAAPLQRRITTLERAKSRSESANEGIKLENQQLQTQLLQIDATYKLRIQELEESYQAQIDDLQGQMAGAIAPIRSDSPSPGLATGGSAADKLIQDLNTQHQAEILAYQQQISELQTALAQAIASAPEHPSPAPPASPSNFSGGVAPIVTGLAGAAAGVAAGIGLSDLLTPPTESLAESTPLPETLTEPEVEAATPEPESPSEGDNPLFPQDLFELAPESRETSAEGLGEALDLDIKPETLLHQGSAPEELILLPDEPTLIESAAAIAGFAPVLDPSPPSEVLPILPDAGDSTEHIIEDLEENTDFDVLDLASFLDEPLVPESVLQSDTETLEEADLFSLESLPSTAELTQFALEESDTTQESFSWLEIPPLDEDLPSFFSETDDDFFTNLFETETTSSDLAFLEFLQTEEEPLALEREDLHPDPLANLLETEGSLADWDFGDLLPTDDESHNSSFDFSGNGEHEADLDALFDSLSLPEEK